MSAQPVVRTYALSVLRDFHQAEDLMQEVAMSAWLHFGDYDPGRPFLPWVLGIARLKCIDLLRTRKSSQRLPDDLVQRIEEDALAAAESNAQRNRALAGCIERLTENARTAVHLRFECGLATDEIAFRQGRNAEAVRKLLARTRAFLVQCTQQLLAGGAR